MGIFARNKKQGVFEYFFGLDGRLNRKSFFIRLLIIRIVKIMVVGISFINISDDYGNTSFLTGLPILLALCIFIYANYCINVRRQKDLVGITISSEQETRNNIEDKKDKFILSKGILVAEIIHAMLRVWPTLNPTGDAEIWMAFRQSISSVGLIAECYLIFQKGWPGSNKYGMKPSDVSVENEENTTLSVTTEISKRAQFIKTGIIGITILLMGVNGYHLMGLGESNYLRAVQRMQLNSGETVGSKVNIALLDAGGNKVEPENIRLVAFSGIINWEIVEENKKGKLLRARLNKNIYVDIQTQVRNHTIYIYEGDVILHYNGYAKAII